MYAGCPIHWVSKLQTEIALSTAEAEYIALSRSHLGGHSVNEHVGYPVASASIFLLPSNYIAFLNRRIILVVRLPICLFWFH